MEIIDDILTKLNTLLECDNFSLTELAGLISQLKEVLHSKFKLFDFVFYNEKLQQESKERKTASIKSAQYEMAAKMRDIELMCEKHLQFKNERNVIKSKFIYEKNHLIYLHLGNAKNDITILDYFKMLG